MDAFLSNLRKIRQKPEPFDDQIGEELSLEDDDTFPASSFAGQLSFAQGDCESPKDFPKSVADISSYIVPYKGNHSAASRVTFEVTSAEVIKDAHSSSVLPGHSSHVDYTITVTSSTGLSDIPTQITRRYSDFENLNKILKKRLSSLLTSVVFPSKVLMGNFSRETIAKRSRSFEQYLTHLYSILDVRYSTEFTEFFSGDDYSLAMQNFVEGKYFQVIPMLEHYLPIMEKLYGNSHNSLSVAVCALVVSHTKTDRRDVANTYATLALQSLPDSPLTIPLLNMASRLRWSLGCDKMDIEHRLQQLKEKGVNINFSQDLEEELCQIIHSSC